jgi:hypothetical protein
MSGGCVISLLRDYDVKEAKLDTLKLKRDDNTEKETFDVEKSEGTIIEICLALCYRFKQCLQEWSLQVQ